MFISGSGNVGIRTASPQQSLHVNGGIGFGGGDNAYSQLSGDQGGSIELGAPGTYANPVTNGAPYIDMHYGTGAAQDYNVRLQNIGNNIFSIYTYSGGQVFNVNGGNVGIGTNSPAQLLHVNGTAYATTFLHTSDRRLKTDIVPVKNALEIVEGLEGTHFKWKKDNKPSYGVIAQDVEKIMPDAVTTNADGTKAVDYDQIIAPLIEAIKAQQKEIKSHKAEIVAIKARMERK